MLNLPVPHRPGLLVSVRNSSEALAALAGGADVIDVKEPDRGALGAADPATIASVVRAVDGRAMVTAAAGELSELEQSAAAGRFGEGVALVKLGLSGYGPVVDWPTRWRKAIAALTAGRPTAGPVAVAYADWDRAAAPEPLRILAAAIELNCPALLIDTWDKSAGTLFDHWPIAAVDGFVETARSHGLSVVLAGSLCGESFAAAAGLWPDLVAVRGAACEAGRNGTVTRERVQALRATLTAWQSPAVDTPAQVFP